MRDCRVDSCMASFYGTPDMRLSWWQRLGHIFSDVVCKGSHASIWCWRRTDMRLPLELVVQWTGECSTTRCLVAFVACSPSWAEVQLQQSSDLSSNSLVPRPSHRPVFVLLQYAYCELSKTGHCKRSKTERQEGLGTRLTSQIPPKGVYSSVARESATGKTLWWWVWPWNWLK